MTVLWFDNILPNFTKWAPLGEPLEPLGRPPGACGLFFTSLGLSLGAHSTDFGVLGSPLGLLWARFGAAWGCLGLPLRSFGLSSRPFDRFWGPWVALWTPFGRPGAATVSPSTLLGSLRTSLGPPVGPCGLSLDSFRFLWVPLGFPCGFLGVLPGLTSASFWLNLRLQGSI